MQYLYEILDRLISEGTVSHKSSSGEMQLLADHLEGHGFSVRLQHPEERMGLCGEHDRGRLQLLDQAHQPDESIGRKAFESGAEIALRVLERLCGARTLSREQAG